MIISDTEWADMQRSLDYYEQQNASLVEGVCTMFDAFALATGNLTMCGEQQGISDNPHALAFKDVIQSADFLLSGYRDGQWHSGTTACAEDLKRALAHPAIAALIDAWATREG